MCDIARSDKKANGEDGSNDGGGAEDHDSVDGERAGGAVEAGSNDSEEIVSFDAANSSDAFKELKYLLLL